MALLQETAAFDPLMTFRAPGLITKLYIFFLFFLIILAIVKAAQIWAARRRFKSQQQKDPYRDLHWSTPRGLEWLSGCQFLTWCAGRFTPMVIPNALNALSHIMTMTLFVALLLYLTKWYAARKLDALYHLPMEGEGISSGSRQFRAET